MMADEGFVNLGQKFVVGNEFYYNALIHQYKSNRKASAPSPINALISLPTNGTPCSYILQKKTEPK